MHISVKRIYMNLFFHLHHRTLCDGVFTHTNMSIILKQIYIILCCFASSHTVWLCIYTHKYGHICQANLYKFVLLTHRHTVCRRAISQLNAILSYTQTCTYLRRKSIFLHQHTVGARARKGTKLDSTPTWLLQVACRCARRVSLASRTIVACTALYI